ncbi:MAG: (Fe-S)-binding protein, partial [Primorskyibacter sp.]
TGARAFGDLGDPDSAVSQQVADRGGFDLMAEMGYKPVNKYLPPRKAKDPAPAPAAPAETVPSADGSALERLFAWVDKTLS